MRQAMISIIIPAYNEEKYISHCLESITAQKYRRELFEVILVDNASTDRTAEVAARAFPGVKLIHEPRKGLTIAYNRGAKEAKGDILAFVDADMILPRNHLMKIAQAFDANTELVALSGPYIYRDAGKMTCFLISLAYLLIAIPAELLFNRLLNLGASIASGNSAVKREAFLKIGGFNEEVFFELESDFTKRIIKLGSVRFKYSMASVSSARRLINEGTIKILLRHIIVTIWPYLFKRPFREDVWDVR
jgi:glycosyltransferase involved in cell wall biosynthesis